MKVAFASPSFVQYAASSQVLAFVYMRMLLHLERTFTMPDVVRMISQEVLESPRHLLVASPIILILSSPCHKHATSGIPAAGFMHCTPPPSPLMAWS